MKYPKRAGMIDKLYKNKSENQDQYQNNTRDFPADSPYHPALAEELRTARRNLSAAYGEFNQATEPVLIEACVYRIRAETARCDYLLRAVKASGKIFAAPERVSDAAAIEAVPGTASGTADAIEAVHGINAGSASGIFSGSAAVPAFAPDMDIININNDEHGVKSS